MPTPPEPARTRTQQKRPPRDPDGPPDTQSTLDKVRLDASDDSRTLALRMSTLEQAFVALENRTTSRHIETRTSISDHGNLTSALLKELTARLETLEKLALSFSMKEQHATMQLILRESFAQAEWVMNGMRKFRNLMGDFADELVPEVDPTADIGGKIVAALGSGSATTPAVAPVKGQVPEGLAATLAGLGLDLSSLKL